MDLNPTAFASALTPLPSLAPRPYQREDSQHDRADDEQLEQQAEYKKTRQHRRARQHGEYQNRNIFSMKPDLLLKSFSFVSPKTDHSDYGKDTDAHPTQTPQYVRRGHKYEDDHQACQQQTGCDSDYPKKVFHCLLRPFRLFPYYIRCRAIAPAHGRGIISYRAAQTNQNKKGYFT